MMKASRWHAATPVTAWDGDSAATRMPATAGPAACCSDGADGAFHAVGRQQVLRRQDPGQDRGVGREEERRPDAQDEGAEPPGARAAASRPAPAR